MLRDMVEVWKYRELLWNLVVRDIKVRYKNSLMGFLWSLLNPLLQVATITLVFKYIIGMRGHNFSAYLLCAILPWFFIQLSILESCTSVLNHSRLVKKNYFPREILPMSVVFSNLTHLALAFVVFFIYVVFYLHAPVTKSWLLLPVVTAINVMFTMGICFFVAAMNIFYEDVKYLANAILNLLFYLMPILFPIEMIKYSQKIPDQYRELLVRIYSVNPVSYTLSAYKKILLLPYGYELDGVVQPDLALGYKCMALAAVISLVVMLLGYAYFNRKKWTFAELF